MNKYFLKILIVVIFVIVAVGGFFAWQKFFNNETDNWKNYYNELYGVELSYPASWALNETPAGNFIQINVSNGVRGTEDESMSPCQSGIAALVFQIGKLREGQQIFEEFVNFEIENPERGQPPAVKPELIQTTVGEHNAIKISDAHNSCDKDFYYIEQSSNSYATISSIVDRGEDKLIIDKIISTIRFLDRAVVSTLPTICEDKPEGTPIITSLSSYSVSVGSKFEIIGCNFSGFEGDENAWIENNQGVRGFLRGEVGSTSKLLKITLSSPLCQKDTSYSGLQCDAWLTLTPGIYKIYTLPWGKKSNEVTFTIKKVAAEQIYRNKEYGFEVILPDSWNGGYSIIARSWTGYILDGSPEQPNEQLHGPEITVRNPKWTEVQPWQDIPIMVFTKEEWNLVESIRLGVSAAPIGPSKLGENQKYVFALPPRWVGFTDTLGQNEAIEITKTFKAIPD